MEIKNIKVRSQASRNYQVGEIEIEFSVNPGEEKEMITKMQSLVNKLAVEQVNSLCELNTNNNHPAQQTIGGFRDAADAQPAPVQRQAVSGVPTYRPRSVGTSNYQSGPKPISDAQMRCLIGYGYDENQIKGMTSKQASDLIGQLKGNR